MEEIDKKVVEVENKEAKVEMKVMETSLFNDLSIEVLGEKREGDENKFVYRFVIPFNAPLSEAMHACANVQAEIKKIYLEISEKHKADLAKKNDEEANKEVVKEA